MKIKKTIYDVYGYNNYTHGESHHYFTSKTAAVKYLNDDIRSCTTPNEENGWKAPWCPEDIRRIRWNLVDAADEYTWKIVRYDHMEEV